MVATITFNPFVTSNAAGSFNFDTTGYIQGTILDNPVELFKIAGGIVGQTETIPMYGGICISESIPQPYSQATLPSAKALGGIITRTASVANYTGFTVYNMLQSAVNSPQSPVPLVGSGGEINFVRRGSNVRLAVACDPSLVSLNTGLITQQVSWDFNNQVLQPFDASTPTYSITSMVWSNTLGGQVAVVVAVPSLVGAVGDAINISGATNTGTGGNAIVNGNFVVNTWTDSQHFTFLLPAAPGVVGTIGGTPVLNEGTGALPVQVLDVSVGNSMTVVYSQATGFANWNRSGATAIIVV